MFSYRCFRSVLGVATPFCLSLLVLSCTKDDEKDMSNFIPTGTYKVQDLTEGNEQLDDASGQLTLKDSGNDKFKVGVKDLSYKGIPKDLSFDLEATVKKIDEKAYSVDFEKYDNNDPNFPFKFKYAIDATAKVLLGVDVDEIVFDDSSIEGMFTLIVEPSSKKVTYDGKQYTGVVQKDSFELMVKISATLKIDITQAQLLGAVKDNDVKKALTEILAYTDSDGLINMNKKKAFTKLLTDQIAKFQAGSTVSKELQISLKK